MKHILRWIALALCLALLLTACGASAPERTEDGDEDEVVSARRSLRGQETGGDAETPAPAEETPSAAETTPAPAEETPSAAETTPAPAAAPTPAPEAVSVH